MIGVTPVGVFTYLPEESRRFYHGVLGVEKVCPLQSIEAAEGRATVLRLESPQIEVFSVEIRNLEDSPTRGRLNDSRLILRSPDLADLQQRLISYGVAIGEAVRKGFRFEDLNGITWEASPEPS